MRKQWVCSSVLALGLALNGCGDTTATLPEGGVTPQNVTEENTNSGADKTKSQALIQISGVLEIHKVSRALSAATQTDLSVGEPGDLHIQLANPLKDWEILAEGPVKSCADGLCQWSFDKVDISGLSLGLVALITDKREKPQFEVTAMGLIGQGTIADLKTNPRDYQIPIPAWVVSTHSLQMLSKLTETDPSLNRKNGYVFGMALSADARPEPVEGVTIEAINPNIGKIFYPKADFSGLQKKTSKTGFFFAASVKEQMIVSPWKASVVDNKHNWSQLFAGTQPGMAFVLLWRAEAAPM